MKVDEELDFSFYNIAKNASKSNIEADKRVSAIAETLRRNSDVSGQKVTKVEKKINWKNITIAGVLILALFFASAYGKTKSEMQGKELIGGSSGFMTVGNGTNPSFGEVIEKMFGGR